MNSNEKQRRKFLLALPVLILPFITLGFWALGGGTANAEDAAARQTGLNVKLPDANNSKGAMDKMAYYDQAAQDSLKRKEQYAGDPYSRVDSFADGIDGNPAVGTTISNGISYQTPAEQKVYDKLAALQKAMDAPTQQAISSSHTAAGSRHPGISTSDIDRLEKMMTAMQSPSGTDPETVQLNAMLEKILDIQHPERVQDKQKQKEDIHKGRVYPVTTAENPPRISSLEVTAHAGMQGSGFYGLDDSLSFEPDPNAIAAVIHEDQTLVNGSTVKLRLTDGIAVSGNRIPKNSFIYGIAQLDGERLVIKINSLRYRKSIYPVQLSVFDIDGLDGIYIPGAISRDVAKQSGDRSLQNLGLSGYDPSLGAQAVSAGIEATKTLLSKKVKLIKVFVKAGYQVLLRDDKQKEGSN